MKPSRWNPSQLRQRALAFEVLTRLMAEQGVPMRKVNVETEVVTCIPALGDEPYFVAYVYRNGKQVYECVKSDKDGIADKALRGYSAHIKPCTFVITARPERTQDARKKTP